MDSRVTPIRDRNGDQVAAAWNRTLRGSGRPVFSGAYSARTLPGADRPSVHVAFPLESGNVPVFLRPTVTDDGGLLLESPTGRFGQDGAYVVVRDRRAHAARVPAARDLPRVRRRGRGAADRPQAAALVGVGRPPALQARAGPVIHSFHLAEVPRRVGVRALLRPPATATPGLDHAECLSLMRLGAPTVSPDRLQVRRLAVFAQWRDEAALERFLARDPLGRRWPAVGTCGSSTCVGGRPSPPSRGCPSARERGGRTSPSWP